MSKSAGNFYTLDQLMEAGFSPVVPVVVMDERDPANVVVAQDVNAGAAIFLWVAKAKQPEGCRFAVQAAGQFPGAFPSLDMGDNFLLKNSINNFCVKIILQ